MLHLDFAPNSSLSIGIEGEIVTIGVRCSGHEMLVKLSAGDARKVAIALGAAAKVMGTNDFRRLMGEAEAELDAQVGDDVHAGSAMVTARTTSMTNPTQLDPSEVGIGDHVTVAMCPECGHPLRGNQ